MALAFSFFLLVLQFGFPVKAKKSKNNLIPTELTSPLLANRACGGIMTLEIPLTGGLEYGLREKEEENR